METPHTSSSDRPAVPSRREACAYWLKLGCISFGGPAGQIALMHADLVDRKRWISESRFLHALNYCMLLPGPEAQQLATYIGWLLHRTWGGIVAGALFALPSLLLLIALSWIYVVYGSVPWIAGAFYGIKPAVVAIVLQAAHRIGSRTLKNPALWTIAAAAFVAIFALSVSFPYIVLGAGLTGAIGGRVAPRLFSNSGGHGQKSGPHRPAVIDDDTPLAPHTRFSPKHLALVAAAGLLLWGLVEWTLYDAFGWHGALTQMGWFFTKAALLTFGGAYAVLPYVYQGAVEQHAWLSAPQMIDGLALGESTPGPLIMIVSFVGFLGGVSQAVTEAPLLAGIAGACVATFFTFLPSFVFILAGAPLVETTHGKLHYTAPLTAITAAVVGVIVNLAVFFAWHVFWPRGLSQPPDFVSLLIFTAAAIALFRFRLGVIPLIGASLLVGLVHSLVA
ncbi:chromate efflux transporter [Fontimonas sp. SYSU GA230001]|uniref:chromate efflux transporter n=1 Tax=Fontimonas sp. SYSU GA230001 TaxID=3142450 RepID=UPI0032B5F3E2